VIFVKWFMVSLPPSQHWTSICYWKAYFLAGDKVPHWELDDFRFDVWPFNMTRNRCLYLSFATYVLDETYQID
jgi:hypothetical protein